MKRLTHAFLPALAAALVAGCAGPPPQVPIGAPPPDKARIVFIRASQLGGMLGCDLFEVVDGNPLFVGQLPMVSKMVVDTAPGTKVFMAYGTAADFMLARVEGGKTYYSVVRHNMGTGGFAPTPIRPAETSASTERTKAFQEWVSGTRTVAAADTSSALAQDPARLLRIYADYWARFQRKSDAEKAQRTLEPQDAW